MALNMWVQREPTLGWTDAHGAGPTLGELAAALDAVDLEELGADGLDGGCAAADDGAGEGSCAADAAGTPGSEPSSTAR